MRTSAKSSLLSRMDIHKEGVLAGWIGFLIGTVEELAGYCGAAKTWEKRLTTEIERERSTFCWEWWW